MTFRTLYNPEQARQVLRDWLPDIDKALKAGVKLEVEIRRERKSREQEEKAHAMIGEVAKQAQHLGCKWDEESWKRLLVNKFCKEYAIHAGKIIQNLDGDGIVQLEVQTRRLTKDQYSQFIEFLHAWGAANGVTYSE